MLVVGVDSRFRGNDGGRMGWRFCMKRQKVYNVGITETELGTLPAAKTDRAAERRRERNSPLRARARTFVRRAREGIESGDLEAAERAVKEAVMSLDKAAARGAIHKNNAARRKSRIMGQLNKARGS